MTIQELEKFIDQYGTDIYSFCRKLCKAGDDADELYQDTWLKAMQKLDMLKTDSNVRSYLLSLAIGIWKNKKKKYAVRERIVPNAPLTDEIQQRMEDHREDVLEQVIRTERKIAVLAAIEGLADVYRIPVLLFYMEEQSVKEIAGVLHIPEGTVKRRLWTARKKLSQKLEVYLDE